MPVSSVKMPRPPCSSAAVMNTRARLTGRALSAVSTRPGMRPPGAGGVSFDWAGVSRVGCCAGRGGPWAPRPMASVLARPTIVNVRGSMRYRLLDGSRAAGLTVTILSRLQGQTDPAVLLARPAYRCRRERATHFVTFVREESAQNQDAARLGGREQQRRGLHEQRARQ